MRKDLIDRSTSLSEEAKTLPDILKINNILSCFKNWKIIGSTKLNLVYKPDLDIKILTEKELEESVKILLSMLKKFIPKEKILVRKIGDSLFNVFIPKWINPKTETCWNLDFGLCKKDFYIKEINNFSNLEKQIQKLNNQKRSLVLEIKEEFSGNEKYGWGAMIYLAVVNYKVKSIKDYLKLVDKQIITPSSCKWTS